MIVTRSMAVVEDLRYREHRAPGRHPECPERLAAVAEAIAARPEELVRIEPRPAEDAEILRVHGRDHLDRVCEAASRAPSRIDADTYLSSRSLEVARLAAGGAIDLARCVARGEVGSGIAAVRPPGHHAESDRAMGFCLLNNVAIAARALQAEQHAERILLVDFDVHHGNGSQRSFEADPSVLYFSTHQFPFYPGTGAAGEIGSGRGAGTTVNAPLPAGCGDLEYLGAFQRLLVPVARSYRPDLILVSSGFDAHHADPLASMEVSEAGFHGMATILRALAEELCQGRIAFVLEGGYSPRGLLEGTRAVLDVALAEHCPALPAPSEAPPGSALWNVVERVDQALGGRYPDLGAA